MDPAYSSTNVQQTPFVVGASLPERTTEVHPLTITEGLCARYQKVNEGIEKVIAANPKLAEPHIETNKAMILEGAKDLKGTVVIMGMGRGSFIPLKELCQQFDKVVAIDTDRSAMERAVKELPEALQGKVVLKIEDLTGLMAQFSTFIETETNQCKDVDAFVKRFIPAISQFKFKPLDLSGYEASYAVSSIVLSQLLSCPMDYLTSLVSTKYNQPKEVIFSNHELMVAITVLSRKIHGEHISQLENAVQKGGCAYLSTSVAEVDLLVGEGSVMKQGSPRVMVDLDNFKCENEQMRIVKSNDWMWTETLPEIKAMAFVQTSQGVKQMPMFTRGSSFLIMSQIRQKI